MLTQFYHTLQDHKKIFVWFLLGLCFFSLMSIPRLLSLDAHWSSDEVLWQIVVGYLCLQFNKNISLKHSSLTTLA